MPSSVWLCLPLKPLFQIRVIGVWTGWIIGRFSTERDCRLKLCREYMI